MDLTSRYRTRQPPREHEEAVKMLLEGIANAEIHQTSVRRRNNSHLVTETPRGKLAYSTLDRNERSSLSASSPATADSSSATSSEADKLVSERPINLSMQSKGTSVGTCEESVSSSSGIDNDGQLTKDPIPSRTIAVQCDLKNSSLKRDHLFDGSMQASSISSTRYGFYNYSPETLKMRLKYLQRATSNRDLRKNQVEAPTSMSELSSEASSASDYDFEREEEEREVAEDQEPQLYAHERASKVQSQIRSVRAGSSMANLVSEFKSSDASDPGDDSANRRRRLADDNSSTARAHMNSLPRRPMTAMSYLSPSRLRESQVPKLAPHGQSMKQPLSSMRGKSRTMSQQVLTRPITPTPDQLNSSASPSDECDFEDESNFRSSQAKMANQSKSNKPVVQEAAELSRRILSNQARVSKNSPNQARGYTTLDRVPVGSGMKSETRDGDKLDQMRQSRWKQSNQTYDNDDHYQQANMRRSNYEGNLVYASESPKAASYSYKEFSQLHPLNKNAQRRAQDQSNVGSFDQVPNQPGKLSSMNARRPNSRSQIKDFDDQMRANIYCTTDRQPRKLLREDRAMSQSFLSKPGRYFTKEDPTEETMQTGGNRQYGREARVPRTISMRQIGRTNGSSTGNPDPRDIDHSKNLATKYGEPNINRRSNRFEHGDPDIRQMDSDDSESPLTKTWTNPGAAKDNQSVYLEELSRDSCNNARTYSRRDPQIIEPEMYENKYFAAKTMNNQSSANKWNNNQFSSYSSSSESSSIQEDPHQRFVMRSKKLDYNSQLQLNEMGLPDVNALSGERCDRNGSTSHLDSSEYRGNSMGPQSRGPILVAGRASSHQSLKRPSMPLSSSRRRGANSNSGSDVGGSSMSLASRLNGRCENAHTRSPVIMYIPQASALSRSNQFGDNRTSTLRKSIRSRQKSNSQDRISSKKNQSRNGSDSESSSILRTLIKPAGARRQGNYASKRGGRTLQDSKTNGHVAEEYENDDGVGQLATEVDSYKFRRRYSVPKDAKINWFTKLKQRVASGGR